MTSLVLGQSSLKFDKDAGNVLNAHDVPVGRARLSKILPRYMVTCGEGKDLHYKLWNV